MTIKQVLYKDIPRNIFKRGWSFSIPPGDRDIYFKLEKDLIDKELWKVIEKYQNNRPKGLLDIEALGRYNYFRVNYHPEMITEEDVIEFIKAIKIYEK